MKGKEGMEKKRQGIEDNVNMTPPSTSQEDPKCSDIALPLSNLSGERLAKEIVGWKVAIKYFAPQKASYLKCGVFTVQQPSLISKTWLIKCVYDDLQFEWFESNTLRNLLDSKRVLLIEDCKSIAYKERRRKQKPQDDIILYNTPLGDECKGRLVKVWKEDQCCFFPGMVTTWKKTKYIHGVSPNGVETARFAGLLNIVTFDKRSEWISDDSARIFWCKKDIQSPHLPLREISKRVGWKMVYIPDEQIKPVVFGTCVHVSGESVTFIPDKFKTKAVVHKRNILWLCGVIDNERPSQDYVNRTMMIYCLKDERFKLARISSYDQETQIHEVVFEDNKTTRKVSLPLEIIRWESFAHGVQLEDIGFNYKPSLTTKERTHTFFGTTLPRKDGIYDGIGMRIFYFDLQLSNLMEGIVIDHKYVNSQEGTEGSCDTPAKVSLHKVVFHDFSTKWISSACHTFEFSGEAGIFEYCYESHLPFRIPIQCNSTVAVFVLGRQFVYDRGSLVTPAMFEANCGSEKQKKWKQSISLWYESTDAISTKDINNKRRIGDVLEQVGAIRISKGAPSTQSQVSRKRAAGSDSVDNNTITTTTTTNNNNNNNATKKNKFFKDEGQGQPKRHLSMSEVLVLPPDSETEEDVFV